MTHSSKENYNWDLSVLYPSDAAWEETIKQIQEPVAKVTAMKGSLTTSAQNLLTALNAIEEISIKLAHAYSYARLSFDTSMGDNTAKTRYERVDALSARIDEKLAFVEPELLLLDEAKFLTYKNELPDLSVYSFKFEKLFVMKKHILSPEMEQLLTKMNSLGRSFKKIFDDIAVNDLTFPEVAGADGQTVTAGEANYLKCMTSQDRVLRENYFKSLLSTYASHKNSIASTYYGAVKYSIFTAGARNFTSSLDMALSGNFIPPEVYDNLLSTVRGNVDKLQQYIALRQKILGLSEIHFYDLFVPVVKDLDKTYTFEEARDIVLDALSVLGEDYTEVLQRAFAERWIDVYPAKGKRSGAYAMGIYGAHPYSLLNFSGNLEDIFTLAHELGHVMHSFYSNENQPYVNSHYTIFTAEVASTVNETLLFNFLLKKVASEQEKANLLSMHLDSIRSTLYRQTFFADFEKQVHETAEKDQPLTPAALQTMYKELYILYYGQDFTVDEELTYEWLRIPHFYSPFYVYQYATGISAAISIAGSILREGQVALTGYKAFLKSGGSNHPINLLKEAGVDMSSPQPIQDALNDFEKSIRQLASILNI